MNIYLTNIENISKNMIDTGLLSVRGKGKFERLSGVNEKKAVQSAVGDLLLKHICKLNDCDFCPDETEKGKPYIKNGNFCFSVSHSENVVAVAVSKEEVGVDTECLKPIKKGLPEMTLNELELDNYNKIEDDGERDRYFYRCFTEKESYLKFLGTGFETLPRDIKSYEGGVFVTKYLFLQSEIYAMTICAKDIKSIRVHNVRFDELTK